jgi:hypothetical protein
MHTPDRRATVPTGIRWVRSALLGSDRSRRVDPQGGSDPSVLPHRRVRSLHPPVA